MKGRQCTTSWKLRKSLIHIFPMFFVYFIIICSTFTVGFHPLCHKSIIIWVKTKSQVCVVDWRFEYSVVLGPCGILLNITANCCLCYHHHLVVATEIPCTTSCQRCLSLIMFWKVHNFRLCISTDHVDVFEWSRFSIWARQAPI